MKDASPWLRLYRKDTVTQSELAEAREFLCESGPSLLQDVNLLLSNSNHLAMASGSGTFRVVSPMRLRR